MHPSEELPSGFQTVLPLPRPTKLGGGGGFFFSLIEGLAKLCLTLNALFLPKKVTDYWGELRETEVAAWNKDMEVLIKIVYFYRLFHV